MARRRGRCKRNAQVHASFQEQLDTHNAKHANKNGKKAGPESGLIVVEHRNLFVEPMSQIIVAS
jgi:hypothetical protein